MAGLYSPQIISSRLVSLMRAHKVDNNRKLAPAVPMWPPPLLAAPQKGQLFSPASLQLVRQTILQGTP